MPMVDGLTYCAFDRTREPVIFGFLTPLESLRVFAAAARIQGIIASCRNIDNQLDIAPQHFGEICRINANQIEELKKQNLGAGFSEAAKITHSTLPCDRFHPSK